MVTHYESGGWQDNAGCRGPKSDQFFPPINGERRQEKRDREVRAKNICAHCVVLGQCLDYALSVREVHGIWGGTSAPERRIIMGLSA
jgi:WhiB family transcriptional regulator, redox-sensing transcriptional regulator